MSGERYGQYMDAGFRRSGNVLYQPICRGCRACQPLRVPVDRFRPDKSQRRCWRRNADLCVTAGTPQPSAEKFELYQRYVSQWHGRPTEDGREGFERFLYASPVPSIEFCYRDTGDRLLAVGICDVVPEALSSVYFYFDPNDAARGLGTFGAIWEIRYAIQERMKYYYLGYWVEACREMRYKSFFRPNEILCPDQVWRLNVSVERLSQSHLAAPRFSRSGE